MPSLLVRMCVSLRAVLRRLKMDAVQSIIDSIQMAACIYSFVITIPLVRLGKSLTKQKEIRLLAMHGDVNLMNCTTYTQQIHNIFNTYLTKLLHVRCLTAQSSGSYSAIPKLPSS